MYPNVNPTESQLQCCSQRGHVRMCVCSQHRTRLPTRPPAIELHATAVPTAMLSVAPHAYIRKPYNKDQATIV